MGTSGIFIWAGRGREREEAEKKGSEQHFRSWLTVIKQYVFYSSNTPPQISTKARSLNCNSAFVPVCHCSLSPEGMHFSTVYPEKVDESVLLPQLAKQVGPFKSTYCE